MAAYFSTPFGFVFLGIFTLLSGVMFTIYNLLCANGSLNGTFDMLKNVSFLVFPMLTMKMFAEDRRLGTEQLLLTSRLAVWQIVLGKLIATNGNAAQVSRLRNVFPRWNGLSGPASMGAVVVSEDGGDRKSVV